MALLWVVLAVMSMAGAVLVLWPLVRYQPHKDISSETMNAMVFRDRLLELEADLQQGRVTGEEFNQLKAELELTLLEDVAQDKQGRGTATLGGKAIMWPLLILIPLVALAFYWKHGFTPAVQGYLSSQAQMNRIVELMMAGDYATLEKQEVELPDVIRAMQQHVQGAPDDHHAWYVLGVSYIQVRMPEQAELAFSRALNLDPNNVDYMLGYTQASVMLNNGQLTPQLRHALMSIIERQPQNPKPYMTLGMASFQGGDFNGAIAIWQQYLQRPDRDERAADLLQRSIAVAEQQRDSVAPSSSSEVATGVTEKPSVQVTVSIADEVLKQVSSADTLFIYAKAVNGPPMPLAVVRQPVGSWPVQATLSDANAMTPMATLSKFSDVVVQARISATGNAIPQSGDWVGPTQVLKLKPGEQSVALEISSRMP